MPAAALEFSASRAGGPGGQHVNRSATRITLRLPISAIRGLDPDALERLRRQAGSWLTAGDELLLHCDEHRSQRRNRDAALSRLRALVVRAARRPKPRRPTKPGKAAKRRRLEDKRQQSEKKRRRRGRPESD